MQSYFIYRTDHSSYFPENFSSLEKEALESVEGFQYLPTLPEPDEWGSQPLVLLTNSQTDLARYTAYRPFVKAVFHANSGYDNLLKDAYDWREIPVLLGNTIRAQAVAEWAISALFQQTQLLRHYPEWDKKRQWPRTLLSEKNILVIGAGHVGQIVIQSLRSLGAQFSVYDPYSNLKTVSHTMGNYNVVILCCHLHEETYYLLNEKFFAQAHPELCLINPARGELVQTESLLRFLARNPRATAYLDVHESEPYTRERYAQSPSVVASPHIAGVWNGLIDKLLQFEIQALQELIQEKRQTYPSTWNHRTLSFACERYGYPKKK
jgi:D-3-phosphoglycerate dehydrogenase